MKVLSGLSLLLFVALSHAAPRLPAVVQAYLPEQVEEEPRDIVVDYWPLGAETFGANEDNSYEDDAPHYPDPIYDFNPFLGSVDLTFEVNRENIPALANDTISKIIFQDLEQRIAEDFRRMQEDFIIFKRLFGQGPTIGHQPSWLLPWDIPKEIPALIPDYSDSIPDYDSTGYDFHPLVPDHDSDDDNIFSGYPFLGFDRPLFPNLPEVPGVGFANPEDLPDNYNNETHEVHSIDGHEVVVNNTINKESGDGFNSFFHHQVIHVRPDEEMTPEEGMVPEQEPEPATEVPQNEIPEENEGGNDDEVSTILPEVENEVDSGRIDPETLPEVIAEVNLDNIPEQYDAADEESESSNLVMQQTRKQMAMRSLEGFNPIIFPADDPNAPSMSFPGPKSAAYVSNSLDEEDFEEVEIEDGERRAPDLSKDTRVNRVHSNKQGMTLVDPDAEVFNYGLVLKEARRSDDVK